jgi:hypothetical protein
MWLQDFFGRPASQLKSSRDQITSHRDRHRCRPRNFERLETRHLLAAAPVTFSQAIFTPLNPISVSQTTGEKPESKLWENDGHWWSVMPDSSGTWIWRLDGTTWDHVLRLTTQNSFRADVLPQGNVDQIFLFDGPNSELASVEYVSGGAGSYEFWSQRSSLTNIALPSSSETATIAVDGNGRMWVASDASTTVEVRYSDGNYSSFSAPITIGTGITTDDISDITALPDGSVGVLWSNQNAKRFYFRVHQPGDDPANWSTAEIAAGQAALNVGAGMADDHLHMAVAADGTIYAAVKTSYDTSGKTKLGLIVRRPNGVWDPTLYPIDTSGTRPIVLLDESIGRLLVAYTSTEGGGDILYRESPLDNISFSAKATLMSGGSLNNVTSTKQNITDQVVLMAEGSGKASSVLLQIPLTVGAPANQGLQVQAGADQTIQLPAGASLQGAVTENGLPAAPGSVNTTWSETSGPGVATFSIASALQTAVTFSAPGTYVLRLAGDDGTHQAFDESTVIVNPILPPTGTKATVSFQDGGSYTGTRDTTLLSKSANSNQGTKKSNTIDGSPDDAALIAWNTSTIPTGSTVTSATITLNITGTSKNTYQIYELKQNWTETGATWNRFSAASLWSTAGAQGANDRGTTVLGTVTASKKGLLTITLNAAGIAVVQKWVNNPATNFGFTIQNYSNADAFVFDSREATKAANRPKLTIGYNLPAPAMLVSAGADQNVQLADGATLHGSFSYVNSAPLPSSFSALWTVTGSPAGSTVSFGTPTALESTVTFSDPGTYVLRLSIDDGVQTAFDELTIIVS